MRHHTAVILISAFLATARGCIYPFEADLDQTEGRMVIEGDIRIGDLTTIQVSHLKSTLEEETKAPFPDYNPTSIVPFYATIEGEDGTRIEARGDNSCVLDTRNLTASQRYKLLIEDYTTGEKYASDWIEVTGRPVLDDSHYSKNEENDEIRFLLSIHSDGSTPYYSIAYDEVYEYHSMATTTLRWRDGAIVDEGTPVFSRTCWMDKATGVQQVVSTGAMVENRLVDFPVRTFSRYDRAISVRYHLTIKASLISAKAYQYWENIDKISYQGGDLFSPIPSEMRGNLYNVNNPEELVLGYISASEVAQCDLYYSNIKEKFYRVSEVEKAYLLLQQIADTGGNAWTLFYNGYYPYYAVYGVSESVPEYYMWIKNSCLDCESMGGEAKKPAVWDELFDEEL